MFGKKSSEKCAKIVFLYSHENCDHKMGEKSAKQFFQKLTNSASKKCWGKMSEKTAKNVFLYSHEYRDDKMGAKNSRNNFSRNTRIVRAKNVWEKIYENSAKNVFYIHTNIMT